MQNLAILTTQNQVSKSQASKNAEQGALTKNNEPNVSFKELLLNQAKPAEPVKPADAPKTEAAKEPAKTASASQSADNAESDAAPKATDTKTAANAKTKPQAKAEKNSDASADTAADYLAQTGVINDVTDKLTGVAHADDIGKADAGKQAAEDKALGQPPAAAVDANAAMIAALNLPVKDFSTAKLAHASDTKTGGQPAPALAVLGDEAAKKTASLELADKKSGTADQLTMGDLPVKNVAMQNLTANHGFNAQLEQRLSAKLLTQEATDKTLTPALTALTSQAPAMLANTSSAAQVAAMNNINVYPGKTGWDEAISQKVVWMVGAAEQTATLTLNPPDLGPLQVVISVNNDKADTTFISQNPEVRKALENGMSNLRQLMDQAGVQLGQTNVNDGRQSAFFQQSNREQPAQASISHANTEPNTGAMSSPRISRVNNGLVDTFA